MNNCIRTPHVRYFCYHWRRGARGSELNIYGAVRSGFRAFGVGSCAEKAVEKAHPERVEASACALL